MKVIDLIKAYWPTAIVVCVILYGTISASPMGDEELPPIPYLDKLIHAVMMGGLLGAISFDWQRSHRDRRLTPSLVWAFFGCVLSFSLFDELLQGYVDNGRAGDPYDFLADCVGAIAAVYLAPPVIRKVLGLKRSNQKP